jgi:UPF0755 protein
MPLLERFLASGVCALDFHIRRYALEWAVVLTILASIVTSAYLLLAPPRPFSYGAVAVISEGMSAPEVARELASAHLVAYPEVLELIWRVTGTGRTIRPGAYLFSEPENVVTIARRLSTGEYGIPSIRITFPEGITVLDMTKKVARAFPGISASDFISAAGPYEGYLFPDTYSFQASATAETIVERMRSTFEDKVAAFARDIAESGHTENEIITLASIVEREAATPADRRMIAGILWNRIEKGMPLQVDAVFGYIYSRQTYSPSYADLGVDSPYNTYHHVGLPPGPICNPGLSSIEAALHPTKSKYFYYLTGRDGLMHYAVNYAGHKANLNTYLR